MLAPAMAWLIPSLDLMSAASVFFGGLFVACMFCHGELAAMKPDPRWLTRFYLMLSLGGALGAVLIAIVAPLVLPGYFEVNIALVLLALDAVAAPARSMAVVRIGCIYRDCFFADARRTGILA